MAKTIPHFSYNGRTYRLISLKTYERQAGYSDLFEEHYNVLQVRLTRLLAIIKHRSLWKSVERERVPNHVMVSLGCFGDTGGWSSELAERCRRMSEASTT